MIIDFHTHTFPDKLAGRAIGALENNILKATGETWRATHSGTADGLRTLMRQDGIDISVVLPIATTVTQAPSINRFAAELNQKAGLISFGSVHPMQPDWEETLVGIRDAGLAGIKLHPEYQGVYIDALESIRVLKKCRDLDLIVVIHAGRDIGMPPPVHGTPEKIHHAIEQVPGVKLVAAHMGGWQMWDAVEEYLVGEDLYFDTSFSITQLSPQQANRMIKKHGADKILFGTDSPWESAGDTLRALERLGLSKEEQEKIRYQNAVKLLNLPQMG